MFRRAALAVTGDEHNEAVQRVGQAAAVTRQAITDAKPVIEGDSATMALAPGGGRGTTLHFRRLNGKWRFDFLRRYRDQAQVDEEGVARWKIRQQAAETAAEIYEKKEERDLNALPLIYETLARTLEKKNVSAATRP